MIFKKAFRPAVVVLIVLNLVTVLILASNKIDTYNEVRKYTKQDAKASEANQSVLSRNNITEISIEANTDLGLKTEAPIAAQVDKTVVFIVKNSAEGDVMKVRGLNDYEIDVKASGYGEYSWVPERTGIFEVVLFDREGTERVTRRINVGSSDRNDFYELAPVEYKVDSNNNISFSTSIFNMPKNSKGNENLPTTQFTIGESGMWTKTIKAYATSEGDKNAAKASITEGKDFIFDRGNYLVTATLKDLYSLDAEDTKSINYQKEAADGHKVIIDKIDMKQEKNSEGKAVEHFIVHARCDHDKKKDPEECDLIYAFSIDDSGSSKNITGELNGYTESNEITIPSVGWTYTLTVKVKHKKNSVLNSESNTLLLPNACEAIAHKTIAKTDKTYDGIEIKNVKIQTALLEDFYSNEKEKLLPTQVISKDNQVGTIYVSSNNYITINVGDNEVPEKLQYSAWVIDGGQNISLEPVYENENDKIGNTFVYYPRTGGSKAYNPNESNTLYVMVSEISKSGEIMRTTTKQIELSIK